jgi:hypothetical protein
MIKRRRPAKLTVFVQEEFCVLPDAGITRSAAAQLLGCAPPTISNALERDPAFRKRVRQTGRAVALHHSERLQLPTPPHAVPGIESSAEHPQRQYKSRRREPRPGASPGSVPLAPRPPHSRRVESTSSDAPQFFHAAAAMPT